MEEKIIEKIQENMERETLEGSSGDPVEIRETLEEDPRHDNNGQDGQQDSCGTVSLTPQLKRNRE